VKGPNDGEGALFVITVAFRRGDSAGERHEHGSLREGCYDHSVLDHRQFRDARAFEETRGGVEVGIGTYARKAVGGDHHVLGRGASSAL
jgi:hypothetical protein